MANLLHQLSERADVVLVDSPPLTGTSDAVVLAGIADAVLLVVDGRKCTRDSIARARRALELVGATVIGVVVNGYDPSRFRTAGHQLRRYYMARPPRNAAPKVADVQAIDSRSRTSSQPSGTTGDK